MVDTVSKEKRSYIMSQVKGFNTKPEVLVRKFLFRNGFRYRVNVTSLPGRPDIVFTKFKTVIFINGCFWHGHDCKKGRLPKTNTEWWESKIKRTRENDKRAVDRLRKENWRILIIWECNLKGNKTQSSLEKLKTKLEKLR